MALQEVRNKSK